MSEEESNIPLEEALQAVKGALSRIALLHLSFSKTILKELGEEKGRDLIMKSIIEYGRRINTRTQKGLLDLTPLGLYDEVGTNADGVDFARGCMLAKVFQEEAAMDVGYLYCYVDAAKAMAMDPDVKAVHVTSESCGDDDCSLEFLQTTAEEQEAFVKQDRSWQEVDPKLFEYTKNMER